MDLLNTFSTLIAIATFCVGMYKKLIKHKSFRDLIFSEIGLIFIVALVGTMYFNFIEPQKSSSPNESFIDTTKNKNKPSPPVTMTSKDGNNTYVPISGNDNNVAVGTNARVVVHKHKTVVVREDIVHPSTNLINQIIDSTWNKETPIYMKYESSQAVKNRAFCVELMQKLKTLGYINIMLSDPSDVINWGLPDKQVVIRKNGNNLMLFVTEY